MCRNVNKCFISPLYAFIFGFLNTLLAYIRRVSTNDMGLFLIGVHWPKILPQNSKDAS
jgi:hypothetical protein